MYTHLQDVAVAGVARTGYGDHVAMLKTRQKAKQEARTRPSGDEDLVVVVVVSEGI